MTDRDELVPSILMSSSSMTMADEADAPVETGRDELIRVKAFPTLHSPILTSLLSSSSSMTVTGIGRGLLKL